MKVQTEKLENSIARLEIELEEERVNQEMDRAAKRIASQVTLPGFRRGKAPRVLVERAVGHEYILQEATKDIVPKAIADALEQEKLDPVAEPDDFNLLETEPFKFEVRVPLVPTVTLGDYKSVKSEWHETSVSDEEVDNVINELREGESEWVDPDPERPVKDGDQLLLDMEETVEGQESEQEEDLTIVLGKHQLMESVESQLIGAEKGQEYNLSSTVPEDFYNQELAGKKTDYKILVKDVKEKRLPETDDEFASRVGQGASSMQELRDRIRESLVTRKESEERDRVVEDITNQIVAASTIDMPDVLVEREIDHQIQHLESDLQRLNMSVEQYAQYSNKSIDDVRNELRDAARERVRRGLVLGEVAKAEDITVEDSDIEQEVARLLEGIGESERAQTREMLESDQWRSRLESEAYDRKLLNRIVEMATGRPLYEEVVVEPAASEDEGAEAASETSTVEGEPAVESVSEAGQAEEAAPAEESAQVGSESGTEEAKSEQA